MTHRLVVLCALVACGKADAPPAKAEPEPASAKHEPHRPHAIDTLRMAVPEGWTARYEQPSDQWLFETAPLADGRSANARIEHAPESWVASPDAYLAQRKKHWAPGTEATIEKRQGVKDGFAMTVLVRRAADPAHPERETYVVRQLGSVWYQCVSESIPDDEFRARLLALCKSLAL